MPHDALDKQVRPRPADKDQRLELMPNDQPKPPPKTYRWLSAEMMREHQQVEVEKELCVRFTANRVINPLINGCPL